MHSHCSRRLVRPTDRIAARAGAVHLIISRYATERSSLISTCEQQEYFNGAVYTRSDFFGGLKKI